MTDALALLGMPEDAALLTIVQEALIPGVDATALAIGATAPTQGTTAIVDIAPSLTSATSLTWPYKGRVSFEYQRLDIGVAFSGLNLSFVVTLPTTTSVIAELLNTAIGIHFSPTDYVSETIDTTENSIVYQFKMSSNSRRYTGSIDILLTKAFI